mgnify:CR=1 FL=1
MILQRLISYFRELVFQNSPPMFLWVPSLCIVLLLLVSPSYLIIRSFGAGWDGFDLVFRMRVLEILIRTILLVISVTAATVVIAVPLAWLQVRTDLYFVRFWRVTTSLPLVIPTYVGGFILVVEWGPKGIIQVILESLTGIDRIPDISGFPGAFLILSLLSFPYVLLPVRAALRRMDDTLEESSRILGHNRIATFLWVTLPLLRPSIIAGALLVALYTLSDFGAVSLMRYETFTWAIFSQYEGSLNRYFGALLSLILMALALVIVVSEGFMRGKSRYYTSDSNKEFAVSVVRLGNWQWVAQMYSGIICLLSLLLPCAILMYWVLQGVQGGEQIGSLWRMAWNSAWISGLAAIVTMGAAIPVAYLSVRFPSPLSSVVERVTYVGFALPGIAVALGLVFLGARHIPWVYQSFWILLGGYLVLFLPAAVGSTRAALLQIQPNLEHAGRSLGRSPFFVMRSVTLPLMRSGVLAGGALVFLLTMKELPATLILSPLGFSTLATSIWSASSEALFAAAAAPSLLLILVAAIPMTLLALQEDRRTKLSGDAN